MLCLRRGGRPLGDPERVLDRALDLPNAVWRFHGMSAAWARCLMLTFRFTAVSDEKREGLVWLGFNLGTGAVVERHPGATAGAAGPDAEWLTPDAAARAAAGPGWNACTLAARVRPLLDRQVREAIAPFLRSMRRRLERDRKRIHEYHDDLRSAPRSASRRSPPVGEKRGRRSEARDPAGRRDRAGIPRQARRPAPQLRAAGRPSNGCRGWSCTCRCSASRC